MQSETAKEKDFVSLCGGSNCCPEARVEADGSVTVREGVFCVRYTPEQWAALARIVDEATKQLKG